MPSFPLSRGGQPSEEVERLAAERASARERRDWELADRLRAQIEDAGWTVVDRGTEFRLDRARPPDVVEDGRTLYGSSASVPSLLDEPVRDVATVVLAGGEGSGFPERTLTSLAGWSSPAGIGVVAVVDASTSDPGHLESAASAVADGGTVDVLGTAARLSPGGALNAGIRRARGAAVVVLDPDVELSGDFVSPIVAALADPTVALAGARGLVTTDLRRFSPAGPGDVTALDGSCLGFRRADYLSRGPLDEKFQTRTRLATWWSLVLRDEGDGEPARRAVALPAVPIALPSVAAARADERDRTSRRDFYRIIDRFGSRRDLIVSG